MSKQVNTAVEILGKIYQIKCSETEIEPLRQAAQFLQEKMRAMREVGSALSIDRVAVITALNLAHQLLVLEQHTHHQTQTINERLRALQAKVEHAMKLPMELQTE